MPAPYNNWDPLLQRCIEPHKVVYPSTPSALFAQLQTASVTKPTGRQSPNSGVLMPPPPPRARVSSTAQTPAQPAFGNVASSPATRSPDEAPGAPAAEEPAMSDADQEAESLRLAYQLQQEEHAAFMHAVRISEPPAPPASAPFGGHEEEEPVEMEEGGETDMDESLRLAIQLQQEELQWSQAAGGGGEDELALAMRLSMQPGQNDDDIGA